MIIKHHNIDVALISETMLNPAVGLKITGYNNYQLDQKNTFRHYRRMAVIIRRNIMHQPVPKLDLLNMSVLGVITNIDGEDLFIYLNPYTAPLGA